jgi:hypothetical protein
MIGTRAQRGALGPAGMKDSGGIDDDSAGPDAQDAQDTGGAPYATVPIDSLSADGTPPSVGDKVNFSVEGVVKGLSGLRAEITIGSIDGESVGSGAPGASGIGESTSQMGDRLRKQTAANDTGY